jgi:peptidoglycan hydrolase CwlO-like protein
MFNDRVRAMNQTHKQDLRLTAVEANNLQADIFAILSQVSALQSKLDAAESNVVEVVMDGGGFK